MESIVLFIFFLLIAVVLFMVFISLAIYFVPVVIAYVRKHNNFVAICILNVFAGWTFLGWLAALLWSLNSDVEKYSDDEE